MRSLRVLTTLSLMGCFRHTDASGDDDAIDAGSDDDATDAGVDDDTNCGPDYGDPPPGACRSSTDCAEGEVCDRGEVVEEGQVWDCVPIPALGTSCTPNGYCPDGLFCDDDRMCQTDIPPGGDCSAFADRDQLFPVYRVCRDPSYCDGSTCVESSAGEGDGCDDTPIGFLCVTGLACGLDHRCHVPPPSGEPDPCL